MLDRMKNIKYKTKNYTKNKYDEETGTSATAKEGNEGGLREVTYRPPVHSKSTTCLGGCTDRRGSAVSNFLIFIF